MRYKQIGKDIEELDSNAKFTYWAGSNDLQVDTTDGTFYVKEFGQGEDEYIVTVWQDDEHFQEVAVKMSNDSKHDAKQILKVGKQLIEVFGVESVNESLNERLEQKPF